MEQKDNNKWNVTNMILVGALVITFVGAIAFTSRAQTQTTDFNDDIEPDQPKPTPSTPRAPRPSYSGGSTFPLKRKSKGRLVRRLQEALIQKYGSSILPDFGADGDWGTETQNALISKGLPTVLDRFKYDALISKLTTQSTSTKPKPDKKPSSTSTQNVLTPDRAKKIASFLRWTIYKKNLEKTEGLLAILKKSADYELVNTYFKTRKMPLNDGKKRTIVGAVYQHFKDGKLWKLEGHFRRMGLVQKNGVWQLSGFPEVLYDQIKALKNTTVWNEKGRSIKIPKDTILGELISVKDGVVLFKTLDGKMLYTSADKVYYA